jgi:hypothetical protein
MKKLKKLGATLLLIAVATLGLGVTAHANCIAPVYHEDGTYAGHISCGSSAGNYMYVDGEFWDGISIDILCWMGVC